MILFHNLGESALICCRRFFKPVFGRPSMAPGVYFRMLLIGFFEGIDSERGMRGG
jgi:hypothetical protein